MKSLLFGNRRSLSLGGLIGTAALAVPSLWGHNVDPTEVNVTDGIAWLASEASGAIVRVNGATAQVDAKVGFEESQGILGVNQNGSSVLVQVGDQVHSIDVAALDWGATTTASDSLVVAEGVAYLVSDDGAVQVLDAVTMETLGEVALGEAPAGRATAVGKRLIVPLSDGTVAVVDRDADITTAEVGEAGDEIHVSAVGDRVVVLNASAGEIYRLDAGRGKLRGPVDVDLPDGELVVPQRLSPGRLWLLVPDTGHLLGIAPSTGKIVTVKVAEPGHELVGPVVDDGNVYLVDRSAKAIVQVPVKTMKPASHALDVPDAGRVDVIAEGGKVFVNDPTSALAVVIDGDDYRNVDKYDDDVATATPPNTKTPPPPRPEPQGPQAPAGPPEIPPAPPANVAAQAGNESATVSWAPGAGGGVASSFFVTYDGGDTIEVPGNRLSTPVEDLENGEEYVFEVWAENRYGESERVASNAVVPNDRVPGTPETVEATAGDATAHVTWAAADDRGNEITEYVITSAPDGITARVPGNTTAADVPGLTNGTNYTFTVTAVNDLAVQGEPSEPSNAVLPYGPPGAPTNPQMNPSDGALAIGWDASANLSEQPVEYQVTVEPADATPEPTRATELTIGGLVNGVVYTITITPSNDRGPGEPLRFEASPGKIPSATMSVNRTGARTFDVRLEVDEGGRAITACTITGGSSPVGCTGDGNYSVSVDHFDTDYTFRATVTNEFGEGPGGSGDGHSNTKTLSVDTDAARWRGSCVWAGHENTRPILRQTDTCRGVLAYVPYGGDVQAHCWASGVSHRDNQLNYSTTYIRVSWNGNTGYMSHLYLSGWRDRDGMISGLRQC